MSISPCKFGLVTLFSLLLAMIAHAESSTDSKQAIAILKKRCFVCHGSNQQQNGLRLDSLKYAISGGDSLRPAFESGNSASSLMIDKITSSDPAIRMPFGKGPLPSREVDLLKDWIDGGAQWPESDTTKSEKHEHWAFNPPARTSNQNIDTLIFKKLQESGLPTSPEANRHTLVRRAYLELIGLPPTPEQIEEFISDKSSEAYDHLLDKLFASPHYGERQARRWLDVARYSDTNGYEKDRARSIWPYRDWVIDAYNSNMPFDQFVIEQLAGDILPDATESQKIATGFHRNAMLNEEGGIDAAEDRFKRTVDRTNTTSTAFLGLTMSCAQCHSHKFDPISRTEYYQFFAFLNNPNESILQLSDSKIETKREYSESMVAGMNRWLSWLGERDEQSQKELGLWMAELESKSSVWTIPTPDSIVSEKETVMTLQEDGSVLAEGDIPNDDVYVLNFDFVREPVTAIRLEVLPDPSLPGGGPGRGTILAEGDFLLTAFEVEILSPKAKLLSVVEITSATEDYSVANKTAAHALDGKADTGWSINGGISKPHHAVYQLASPVTLTEESTLRITLRQDYIHQHTIGRFRIAFTAKSGSVVAVGVPAELESIMASDSPTRSKAQTAQVEDYFYHELAEPLSKWQNNRNKIRNSAPKYKTTLVMSPRASDRVTRIRNRGEFLSPRKKVKPGVPKVLPPLPEGVPLNRLVLAEWIIDKKNPLTARVTMNRLWQQVFGRGIVTTPEDFGVEGEPPTHPQLLDWLAIEFMERNWNLKAMHRLMVSSSTFRQASEVAEESFQLDPENIWLARGPRFRLQAEVIRDLALVSSGLLTPKIGGPSVYPPQPDSVTKVVYGAQGWPTTTGPNRYRRGLYTYMKRIAPYAGFMTFDAPSAESTCVRRLRSNTPLQALTLLNDPVFMEAAQALALRAFEREGNTKKKVEFLFLASLSRTPDLIELESIVDFFEEMKLQFESNAIEAKKLLPNDSAVQIGKRPEVAAWITVCRVMLNLDETITRG